MHSDKWTDRDDVHRVALWSVHSLGAIRYQYYQAFQY